MIRSTSHASRTAGVSGDVPAQYVGSKHSKHLTNVYMSFMSSEVSRSRMQSMKARPIIDDFEVSIFEQTPRIEKHSYMMAEQHSAPSVSQIILCIELLTIGERYCSGLAAYDLVNEFKVVAGKCPTNDLSREIINTRVGHTGKFLEPEVLSRKARSRRGDEKHASKRT